MVIRFFFRKGVYFFLFIGLFSCVCVGGGGG